MKLIIASISLLCMIVPTQCQNGDKCAADDPKNFGKNDLSSNPKDATLCKNLHTLAEKMDAAGVCSTPVINPAISALKTKADKLTHKILEECGTNLKEKVEQELECTLTQCNGVGDTDYKNREKAWKGEMEQCLPLNNGDTAAETCLKDHPILVACKAGDDQCNKFDASVTALTGFCTNGDNVNDQSTKCKEWNKPEKLKDCFEKMKCTGVISGIELNDTCLAGCYEGAQNTCFEGCDLELTTTQASTKASTTSPTTAPAPASKPANQPTAAPANKPTAAPASIQPQNDNDPTSAAPQDQDVTSGEEDEGCMVRANQKIIIAFAATFVAINFLKALPVEN